VVGSSFEGQTYRPRLRRLVLPLGGSELFPGSGLAPFDATFGILPAGELGDDAVVVGDSPSSVDFRFDRGEVDRRGPAASGRRAPEVVQRLEHFENHT
jgi:hypothetical protein